MRRDACSIEVQFNPHQAGATSQTRPKGKGRGSAVGAEENPEVQLLRK